MNKTYVIATLRAILVSSVVVYLRANLLVHVAPETWSRLDPTSQLAMGLTTLIPLFVFSIKAKMFILALFFLSSFYFAQFAASAPAGGMLAKFLWVGFIGAMLPTVFLSTYWAIQLRRTNLLRRQKDDSNNHV